MYWFVRGGFLVLTGMPRPVLGVLHLSKEFVKNKSLHIIDTDTKFFNNRKITRYFLKKTKTWCVQMQTRVVLRLSWRDQDPLKKLKSTSFRVADNWKTDLYDRLFQLLIYLLDFLNKISIWYRKIRYQGWIILLKILVKS